MRPERLAELVALSKARDRLDRDYAETLDVAAMARTALMSPSHFARRFRAVYGKTPYAYLMKRRIARATALIRAGRSVTEACLGVGCTSVVSFSSRFTELVGVWPSAYGRLEHAAVEALPSCVRKDAARPARTRNQVAAQARARPQGAHRAEPPTRAPRLGSGERAGALAGRAGSQRRGAPGSSEPAVMTVRLGTAFVPVHDLDATFARVAASGAEVLEEPAAQPWGVRDCAFRDPSGNVVRISQA